MSLVYHIHFFNKLRRYVGFKNALNAYKAIKVSRSGKISFDFLKHPFRLRVNERADLETFNEVLLRKEYNVPIKFDPEVIIDAGANIGLTSMFFASKYPEAKVIAVEPDKGNYNLLKENTTQYAHITTLNNAIWSCEKDITLVDTDRGANSFQTIEGGDGITVRTVVIDSIMKDHGVELIDILKVDIEGAEKEVFSSGYQNWLPKARVLIVETHDRYLKGSSKAVFRAINEYDFSCKIAGSNLVFYNNELV